MHQANLDRSVIQRAHAQGRRFRLAVQDGLRIHHGAEDLHISCRRGWINGAAKAVNDILSRNGPTIRPDRLAHGKRPYQPVFGHGPALRQGGRGTAVRAPTHQPDKQIACHRLGPGAACLVGIDRVNLRSVIAEQHTGFQAFDLAGVPALAAGGQRQHGGQRSELILHDSSY